MPVLAQRPTAEAGSGRGEDHKLKRHARREQLYASIREAMTRSGVLSASYKFKVLSLDHQGSEFLVMIDLVAAYGGSAERMGEIEALIVQNAKLRYEITVPAVYWRMVDMAAVSQPKSRARESAHTPQAPKPAPARHDPILADEVAAFKQALRTASAQAPAAVHGLQVSSGPLSYALLTGFEDTEMAESPASPALSTTQYGDLV